MTAGYACQVNFSPDGAYLVSGDAEGYCVIWDWETRKRYAKWKAHDKVCIGVEWNPNESSKVATCGWDGLIKYWE
jgi:pre-mRNA-processing factor 17